MSDTPTTTPDLRTRMIRILEETLDYYGKHPARRGVRNTPSYDACQYLADGGRMCAVGRYMQDPGRVQAMAEAQGWVTIGVRDLKENLGVDLDSLLKEEYRGLPIDFWAVLQRLHDRPENWDLPCGLSPEGVAHAKSIRSAIDTGEYDHD